MTATSNNTIQALVPFIARGLDVAEKGHSELPITHVLVTPVSLDIYYAEPEPVLTVNFRDAKQMYIRTRNTEFHLEIDDLSKAGVLDQVRMIRERLPVLYKIHQLADLKIDLGL